MRTVLGWTNNFLQFYSLFTDCRSVLSLCEQPNIVAKSLKTPLQTDSYEVATAAYCFLCGYSRLPYPTVCTLGYFITAINGKCVL
jgi:hypothetical protein